MPKTRIGYQHVHRHPADAFGVDCVLDHLRNGFGTPSSAEQGAAPGGACEQIAVLAVDALESPKPVGHAFHEGLHAGMVDAPARNVVDFTTYVCKLDYTFRPDAVGLIADDHQASRCAEPLPALLDGGRERGQGFKDISVRDAALDDDAVGETHHTLEHGGFASFATF